MPPRYLHRADQGDLDLPKHHDVLRNVSRFCLRAYTLAVESSIWHGGNAHCDKFSCAAVQDEVHFFHCQDSFVCSLRKKYSFLFSPFCQSFIVEAHYFLHALPSQTVFDFLSQRHNKLCHFISDIIGFFWLAKTSNKPISLTTRLETLNLTCNFNS